MSIASAEGTGTAFSRDTSINTQAGATGEVFTGRKALIALRHAPPDWLIDIIARLERLDSLPPNWDSYGALPISKTSVAIAKNVIRELSMLDSLEQPIVTAAPNGHVVFSWDDHQRSLDLEVRSDGQLEYTYESQASLAPPCELHGVCEDLDTIAFCLTYF